MKINLELEVESIAALRTILRTGSDYSLYSYTVLNFEVASKGASQQSVQGGRVLTEHHDTCPFCEQELPKRCPVLCSEEPAA